jgi:hypothetical protein
MVSCLQFPWLGKIKQWVCFLAFCHRGSYHRKTLAWAEGNALEEGSGRVVGNDQGEGDDGLEGREVVEGNGPGAFPGAASGGDQGGV